MRLVERVVGERLDHVEEVVGERFGVTVGDAPLDELGALLGDQCADLLARGLAEVVGLFERVAGEPLRDPHQLLLVDHQPVGGLEHLAQVVVRVRDRLAAVLAVGVLVVPVLRHRARAVQGDERGDVFEVGGRERAEQRAHRPTFELEHADGVAPAEQVERRRVVEGDAVDVGTRAGALGDEVERDLEDVEVAQPEEVHLEQPEVFDPVHLVLRDDRSVLDAPAGFGLALDRQVLGERVARDDDGGGVDAVLAAQTLEAASDVDDALGVGIGLVERAQLGGHLVAVFVTRDLLEARPQRRVAPHDQRRHELGDLVADEVRVAEHACGVAHRGPRLDGGEGDDLRDVVPPVALGRVLDHLAAVAGVEVHVDVGHLLAAGVEEPLEQQVVLDGVDVDDAQAVRHARSRRAPPARTHADAARARRTARGPRR